MVNENKIVTDQNKPIVTIGGAEGGGNANASTFNNVDNSSTGSEQKLNFANVQAKSKAKTTNVPADPALQAQAEQKNKTGIADEKAQKEYNENVALLNYYMQLASPVMKQVEVKHDVIKRDANGNVVKTANNEPVKIQETLVRNEVEKYIYHYIPVSQEDAEKYGRKDQGSIKLTDWINLKFGDNITLDEKTNKLTVKEQQEGTDAGQPEQGTNVTG